MTHNIDTPNTRIPSIIALLTDGVPKKPGRYLLRDRARDIPPIEPNIKALPRKVDVFCASYFNPGSS